MIHIVHNAADVDVLRSAMEMDESLMGEIVQVKDDLAVGPVLDLYSDEGKQQRKQWWKMVLEGGDLDGLADGNDVDDEKMVKEIMEQLKQDEEQVVWIWAGQNKHDVCGYYWLLPFLKEFQGRVYILNLSNLPFLNEKGHVFYPEWLQSIPPREFIKAKKLAREITLSEFEVDPDEWKKIVDENGGIRLLEGGKKLLSKGIDFYDAELKKFITHDWQKASRVIHAYLSKSAHTTGDMFLLWRLKEIIRAGEYDVQGNLGKMKEFEVKRKALPGE